MPGEDKHRSERRYVRNDSFLVHTGRNWESHTHGRVVWLKCFGRLFLLSDCVRARGLLGSRSTLENAVARTDL